MSRSAVEPAEKPSTVIEKITRPDQSGSHLALTIRNGQVVPGQAKPDFTSRHTNAGDEFAQQLAIDRSRRSAVVEGTPGTAAGRDALLEKLKGSAWRDHLATRVSDGNLSANDAGMVMSYGAVIEEMVRVGALRSMNDAIGLMGRELTESAYKNFRRQLRDRQIAYIMSRGGSDRMGALDDFLKLQPDNGNRGALFEAFRHSKLDEGIQDAIEDGNRGAELAKNPPGFTPPEKTITRRPDGSLEFTDPAQLGLSASELQAFQGLAGKKCLLEDKTSAGAFKVDQALDYLNSSYQATVYFLPSSGEANKVLDVLYRNPTLASAAEDGSLRVMFFNGNGAIERATR